MAKRNKRPRSPSFPTMSPFDHTRSLIAHTVTSLVEQALKQLLRARIDTMLAHPSTPSWAVMATAVVGVLAWTCTSKSDKRGHLTFAYR